MTDKQQALRDLLEKVKAGLWDTTRDEPKGTILKDWTFQFDDAYNGSLDAALALHNAVLPGWHVQYLGHNREGWGVRIEGEGISIPYSTVVDRHPCPARAWLIAILKALIAKGEA